MGYDSQGNFSRVHNWEDDRRNDIEIVTDHHDEEDDNFADGLSQCFLRDGRVAMQDDFDAGNFQLKNVREATLDKDAVNFKQLKDQIAALKTTLLSNVNNGLKVGDIKHSLQTANHDNWLLCNGQEISRADYPDLFKVIGVNFGAGNGTTTFNVPDYRGCFIRMLGGNAAKNFYTKQNEGLPNISGNFSSHNASIGSDASGAFYKVADSGSSIGAAVPGSFVKTLGFEASRSSSIYGASTHVTPENFAVNYFIKAKAEA